MAPGAGLREIHLEDRRLAVLGRKNVMMPVAILAGGGSGSAHASANPVDAGLINGGHIAVASAAIHRLGGHIVIRMFGCYVGVAAPAEIGGVDRFGEQGLVHEKRNADPGGIGLEQGFVVMTFHAVVFGRFFGGGAPTELWKPNEAKQCQTRTREGFNDSHKG